ncbi:MAG: chitobiase/beta-hexosaminidase C-terminal domain-containing protein [Bacteroidaceae bacterium]|nr:chitobiase/beta-hexosaminidase C-terminal domain-containing protein [Bacteroidaceae bacterium]
MKKFLLSIFAVLFAFAGAQAQEQTATLSFASKAQRTSFSTSKQVWEQNGITLTNNKAKSTSNVADYANPVRFYASSEIIVDCPDGNKITKIVFDCNNTSYATALKNSIGAAATVSSDKVTVSIANGSSSFTIAKLTAQIRMDALAVTYEAAGGDVQEVVEKPVISPASTRFNSGESFVVTITTETDGAEIYYTLDSTDPNEHGILYDAEKKIVITETTTVRAVAVKEGMSPSDIAEVVYTAVNLDPDPTTFQIISAEMGYVNEENVVEVEGRVITATFDKGSNSNNTPKYYTTGTAIRLYAGNTATFTAKEGYLIESVEFTTATGEYAVNAESTVTEGELSIEGAKAVISNVYASEVTFTQGGSKGQVRMQKIVVKYIETWSSFYAPFSVAIPEGIEAYIVTAANSSYLTLEQIYEAIPANTGVILKGGTIHGNTSYAGEITEVSGNLLEGTMASKYITEEAYVLGCVDGEYGFYKAAMNQQDGTAWLANGGKAYLPVKNLPKNAQGAASFSFRFGEGTTAIENVEVENEVKTIFDLTGRRVETITAPGIYIVGGKKVLVK